MNQVNKGLMRNGMILGVDLFYLFFCVMVFFVVNLMSKFLIGAAAGCLAYGYGRYRYSSNPKWVGMIISRRRYAHKIGYSLGSRKNVWRA